MGTVDDIQRARQGDADANNSIAQRVRKVVVQVVDSARWARLRRIKGEEDLAQDVTDSVMRWLPAFQDRGEGSLERLTWRFADYALRDIEKGANAIKRRLDQMANASPEILEVYHSPKAKTQLTPSKVLMYKENLEQLEKKISLLPEREERALRMKHWEGLKIRSIAERLGVNENVAAKLLARAHRHLKSLLDSDTTP